MSSNIVPKLTQTIIPTQSKISKNIYRDPTQESTKEDFLQPIEEWTKEQVGEWLENEMELPQLKNIFFQNGITGKALLRVIRPENKVDLETLVPNMNQRTDIRSNITLKQGISHEFIL